MTLDARDPEEQTPATDTGCGNGAARGWVVTVDASAAAPTVHDPAMTSLGDPLTAPPPPQSRRPRATRPLSDGCNLTRQRILEAALRLFNERGTPQVTTNHVAADAGLSPGNVYYWFRNKQDIVHALVLQWLDAVERQGEEAHDQPAHVHSLWDDMTLTAEIDWKYRFIGREMLSLLHDDPELTCVYRRTYQRRLAAQLAYARRLVRAGMLCEPAPPRSLEDLVEAMWLVIENWKVHRMLMSDDGVYGWPSSGVRPLLAVLAPYLTQQGMRAFEAL
jgi:AcrR family transcriptional regulator